VATDIYALIDELNHEYFGDTLPLCEVKWSRQLTRAAGSIDVRRRLIKLSVPLLIDAYATGAAGAGFEICGVRCHDSQTALREILKHELIHLWLFVHGRPHGHTAEFRAKARAVGQPKTRHGIALPVPKSGWLYHCPSCGVESPRRRRYGRPVACGRCCKKHNGGKFDARFQLRGRRIV